MKAAITVFNGRTNLDGKSIRSIDIKACRDFVSGRSSYEAVDFVNIKPKRTKIEDPENESYFKDFETTSLNDYEHVYVYNYTANFFGGSIPRHVIKQLKELSKHNGKLFYIQTDPELHLVNLVNVICASVQRGRKLTFATEEKLSQVDIDAHRNLRWNLIYNGVNVDDYVKRYLSVVKEDERYTIDSFEYTGFFERLYANLDLNVANSRKLGDREFDLVYYGNWRPERAKVFRHYFVGNGLTNYFIGLKPSHLKKYPAESCTFTGSVDHALLGQEVNKAVASIVIGDPMHCSSQIRTARFFENIKSNVVSFIDINYDPQRNLYMDKRLREHLYVDSVHDIRKKLHKIKANPELFNAILELQHNELKRYQ